MRPPGTLPIEGAVIRPGDIVAIQTTAPDPNAGITGEVLGFYSLDGDDSGAQSDGYDGARVALDNGRTALVPFALLEWVYPHGR